MPQFTIITHATVSIEETWTVEAATAEEAEERLFDGHESLAIVSERSLEDEHDRDIVTTTKTTA